MLILEAYCNTYQIIPRLTLEAIETGVLIREARYYGCTCLNLTRTPIRQYSDLLIVTSLNRKWPISYQAHCLITSHIPTSDVSSHITPSRITQYGHRFSCLIRVGVNYDLPRSDQHYVPRFVPQRLHLPSPYWSII